MASVFALVGSPDQLASIDYGTATASNQIQRLVLLAVMTAITSAATTAMTIGASIPPSGAWRKPRHRCQEAGRLVVPAPGKSREPAAVQVAWRMRCAAA